MEFTFQRINEEELLVTFDNGEEQVMTNDELTAFLEDEKVTLQGINFDHSRGFTISQMMDFLLKGFLNSMEEKSSFAGDRVQVQVVKEEITDDEEGRNIDAVYKIVKETTGEFVVDVDFHIEGITGEKAAAFPEACRLFLQLYYSGIHATNEDKVKAFEVFGLKAPDEFLQ
ncbi:hypothetical protein JK635_07360 [Neobacillus sp. YIM B02564]|uniref:Uncharacterized protein n=1 Tax=Neobacillus paridis TaxID=2803862 RepID=A0ABS1TL31_9BACI|nr:hypothetical protein [Neobacillus paridis]MBL4952026.1 hypothetical protein [Neobacillus paridis]